jgi:hypothetical protein
MIVVFLAALVGIALSIAIVVLGSLIFFGDAASSTDLMGYVAVIGIGGALLTLLVYAPVLHFSRAFLRARGIGFSVGWGALVLNLPVFIIIAIGMTRGGVYGPGEGPLIGLAFAVLGGIVAGAYAWHRGRRENGRER